MSSASPDTPAEPRPAVLFLCGHNAGRSQMAAGWLSSLSRGVVDVFSGGSNPSDEINANAVTAMAEVDIDISDERPKKWDDETVRIVDVIISMGCGDTCPVYPGKRYEDWELTDPAGQSLNVVREVRDQIRGTARSYVDRLHAYRSVRRAAWPPR